METPLHRHDLFYLRPLVMKSDPRSFGEYYFWCVTLFVHLFNSEAVLLCLSKAPDSPNKEMKRPIAREDK